MNKHLIFSVSAIIIFFGIMASSCTPQKAAITQKPTATLVATYWKLTELNAVKVESKVNEEIYIQLQEDHTFKGFAGCNQYWGLCKWMDTQLRFTNINRTKKGCDDIYTENELIQTLEKTTAYIINANKLQLLTPDGHIIAVFEAGIGEEKK